jgi:uncharacterized small protein (DUF1192 family)
MADWAAMVDSRDAEITRLRAELETSTASYWRASDESDRLRDLLRSEKDRADNAIRREDVADEHAEEVAADRDRYRAAWQSARRRSTGLTERLATSKRDADLGWEHAETADKDAAEWAGLCKEYMLYARRLARYRLAWLSARRRSGTEAQYATEALALRDVTIRRLKAELAKARQSTSASHHIGRSWDSHPLEDACPCPQEPCGLVDREKADPTCTQHAAGRCKTMRQGHRAGDCPRRDA